jgi:hypothetical protein
VVFCHSLASSNIARTIKITGGDRRHTQALPPLDSVRLSTTETMLFNHSESFT